MDLATRNQLPALHRSLTVRLEQLSSELQDAQRAALSELQPQARDVGDLKDEAARAQDLGLHDAETRRDFAEAQSLRAALKRMHDGVYGLCQDCGEPIPLARLQVQPAAACCADCQAVHERRPPQGDHGRG